MPKVPKIASKYRNKSSKKSEEYKDLVSGELQKGYKQKKDAVKKEKVQAEIRHALSVEESVNQKLAEYEETKIKPNLTDEEKAIVRKRIELLKLELKKKTQNNPLCRFTPNGKQQEAISLVGEGKLKIFVLSAGNGFGKTAMAVNLIGNIIWGAQPFVKKCGTLEEYCDIHSDINWVDEWGDPPKSFYKGPIYDKWPFPKVLRIASDQKNVDDEGAVQEEIDRWWPKDRFKGEKGKYPFRSKMRTDSGWRADVLTYEMEAKQFESKTLGLIWFDEPPPSRIWGSVISRMRRGGIIIITMTPLFEAAYLFNEIIEKAPSDAEIDFIYADVEDNCIEHGIRGVLRHEDIASMVKRYPPAEREARKSGAFLALSGRIHSDFKEDVHCKPAIHGESIIPTRQQILMSPENYQFYQVIDPHDRKFDAVGYYAMDMSGRKYVLDEWPDKSMMPYSELGERTLDYSQTVQILKKKERLLGLENIKITRLMDKRFASNKTSRGSGTSKRGKTVKREFEDAYGKRAYFLTNMLDDWTACRNKLDFSLQIQSDGLPMLIFFQEYCQNHIFALRNWLWDRWQGKTQEIRDIKEKPQEKNSDFPRLLHYFLIFDPRFNVKAAKQNESWREKLRKSKIKAAHHQGSWMGK